MLSCEKMYTFPHLVHSTYKPCTLSWPPKNSRIKLPTFDWMRTFHTNCFWQFYCSDDPFSWKMENDLEFGEAWVTKCWWLHIFTPPPPPPPSNGKEQQDKPQKLCSASELHTAPCVCCRCEPTWVLCTFWSPLEAGNWTNKRKNDSWHTHGWDEQV